MNTSTFNLFVVTISIAVCWAGVIPVLREGETKESCQSYFNGNTGMLCWTLAAKCYCFSTDSISGVSRLDWKNADLACRNEGMALLSVESQEEDQLINRHIKTTQELAVDYYWTSGRYSQEGKDRWEWATVTQPFPAITYTNWYVGYPTNNQSGSYIYINYNFPNGYWFHENRSSYILFICESVGDPVTTTDAPISTTTINQNMTASTVNNATEEY